MRAEWLARIDSDDLWYPERLERQMAALAEHPDLDLCFSWCNFIDEHGHDIRDLVSDLPESLEPSYQTQREWLRHFYYRCNCLIHSSVLMRTSLMRETGDFELTYRQLHDFDYWVRIAKRHNILVVPERLVAMRKFVGDDASNENASSPGRRNVIRTFNEFLDIRSRFFEGMPDDVFVDAFREDFARPGSSTPEELACEKALLLCRPQDNWDVGVTPAGLRALKALYDNEATRRLLETRYGMPLQRFYEMATESLYNDLVVKGDVHYLATLVESRRVEGERLHAQIDALRGEVESLQGRAHSLEALLGEKDVELAALRAELDCVHGSTSWRVTKPLRALGRMVQGARGGRDRAAGDDGPGSGGGPESPEPGLSAADAQESDAPAPESQAPNSLGDPFVLVQAHLSGNLGDDLFVRALCGRYPATSFRICVDGDYGGRFSDIPNLELRPLSEFGTLVPAAEAVVHISGSCFVRDGENFDAFYAADKFLADNAQRLYLVGSNFGPYENDAILEAYRGLFCGYDGITFRDRYSVELFRDCPNVAYAPDVLFCYPGHVVPKRRSALVCPISFEGRDGTFGISGYAQGYRAFTLGAIRAFLRRGYEVTLVSFNQSQGDEREIGELLASLGDSERAGQDALLSQAPEGRASRVRGRRLRGCHEVPLHGAGHRSRLPRAPGDLRPKDSARAR